MASFGARVSHSAFFVHTRLVSSLLARTSPNASSPLPLPLLSLSLLPASAFLRPSRFDAQMSGGTKLRVTTRALLQGASCCSSHCLSTASCSAM